MVNKVDKKMEKISIGEVLNFSFSWIRDREVWKYYGILFAIYLISMIASILVWSSIGVKPFLPDEEMTSELSKLLNENGVLFLLQIVVVLLLLSLVAFLIRGYFEARLNLIALKAKNITRGKFDLAKYMRYILLLVAEFLCAVFCWFNKKWILIAVVPLGLAILSVVAAILSNDPTIRIVAPIIALLLIILAAIPYSIIVIYNHIRLSMGTNIFLSKDVGIIKSLELSWNLTNKRVIEIFCANFICTLVFLVPLVVAGVVVWIFSLVSQPLANAIDKIFEPLSFLLATYLSVGIFNTLLIGSEDERSYRITTES